MVFRRRYPDHDLVQLQGLRASVQLVKAPVVQPAKLVVHKVNQVPAAFWTFHYPQGSFVLIWTNIQVHISINAHPRFGIRPSACPTLYQQRLDTRRAKKGEDVLDVALV
ncbi:MAG: hypothetical protein AABO41_16700 [Acidobacteriota bacterium]